MARASLKQRIYEGAVAGGRLLRVRARHKRPDSPGRLRVLMYHKVTAARPNGIAVMPQAFEAQQEYLAGHYSVISLDVVLRHARGEGVLPPRAVLLTFDDGYRDNLEVAMPVLERFGHPATIFVPTDFIDTDTPLPHDRAIATPNPTLTWEELHRLRSVFTVGSHGCSHRVLTSLPGAEASREIAESKRILERRLGAPVPAFSYPKGSIGDFDATHERAVRSSGYELAFTTLPGVNRPGFDPLRIRRHNVEDYGMRYFAALLDGTAELLALKDTRAGYRLKHAVRSLPRGTA